MHNLARKLATKLSYPSWRDKNSYLDYTKIRLYKGEILLTDRERIKLHDRALAIRSPYKYLWRQLIRKVRR